MATSVLVTGVSRRIGIAWTVVEHLHQGDDLGVSPNRSAGCQSAFPGIE